MKASFVLIIIFLGRISGKDNYTIEFLKSYIRNEGKPTILIYSGLCWGKHLEVNLLNKMSKSGVRCSSSMAEKSIHQDQDLLFFADLECPDGHKVLINATSKNLFQFPFRWLVLSNLELVDPARTALWSCPILTSSDLVLAENNGKQITLTELHRPSMQHSMVFTPRGFYNGTLFDTRPHRELYRRRKNLMGHPLTMANVIQDSNASKVHVLKEDRLDLHNDAATKTCWAVAKHSFEMMNATGQSIFSYRWGYKVNGQWSGMISDIESNKADLGTNCVLYADRLDVVTFTDVFAPINVRFIFRQPPLTYTSNIYTLPFSADVWLALLVVVAASTLTLFCTSLWEVRMERNLTELDGSISDALLLTISAVTQQGCFIEPAKAPGRIMEWFLFAALMALYAAYSANIVVLLQAPSNSIRTLAQLASSKMKLAAVDIDYNRFILSRYKDPLHVSIYQKIVPEGGTPYYYSTIDGVEKIRQGLFAFHSIVEPIYRRIEETFLETEKCDLAEVDFVNGFDAFIPVKKDSPYLEIIRVTFKQIREAGIQKALAKRVLVPKPKCSNTVSAFSSVGLLDMQPVLMFMLYGLVFSVLIFIAEVGFYKLHNKVRRVKKEDEKTKNCWKSTCRRFEWFTRSRVSKVDHVLNFK